MKRRGSRVAYLFPADALAPRTINPNRVLKPDMRLLDVIVGLCNRYHRVDCFPKLHTVQRLLWTYHKVRMSMRTMIRHMNTLREQLYLIVRPTWRKGDDGIIHRTSNRYKPGARGIMKQFYRLRACARWIADPPPLRPPSWLPKMAAQIGLILKPVLPLPTK